MMSRRFTSDPSARRHGITMLCAALILALLFIPGVCRAQSANPSEKNPQSDSARGEKPTGDKAAMMDREDPKTAADQAALTDHDRAELLKLIRELQERVAKLESAQGQTPTKAVASATAVATTKATEVGTQSQAGAAKDPQETGIYHEWGSYTPNRGFKVVSTEHGDLNISIYSYARYLNQRALDSTYVDAFGNTKTVQQRQDFQLQKVQIKFLGWIMSPQLRYFLYAWTSNANQGRGAQVVVAGNMGYTFNKYVTLAAGITSLPGTRSVEGNFPFWLGVDSRHIADEYFRPSYTTGIFARGDITDKLKYQVMLGNNMSILGVSAAQLDKHLNTFSSALIWTPTTGEFGSGFGDFENHDTLASRLAVHFNRSRENKESQPSSESPENTQLRISDGSIIFTPDLFGPGISVTDATWKMTAVDGGLKYHGFALEGEYYWRWIHSFSGTGVEAVPSLFDHGFQLQGSAMVIPNSLQAYVGHSKVFGQYGNPWDLRFGTNWFPFKNKVVRWNTEGLYLYKSPVGYTSVPFAVGGRGMVFHSTFELAF